MARADSQSGPPGDNPTHRDFRIYWIYGTYGTTYYCLRLDYSSVRTEYSAGDSLLLGTGQAR